MLTCEEKHVFMAHSALHVLERSPQLEGWEQPGWKSLSGSCSGKGKAGAPHVETLPRTFVGKGDGERGVDVEEGNGSNTGRGSPWAGVTRGWTHTGKCVWQRWAGDRRSVWSPRTGKRSSYQLYGISNCFLSAVILERKTEMWWSKESCMLAAVPWRGKPCSLLYIYLQRERERDPTSIRVCLIAKEKHPSAGFNLSAAAHRLWPPGGIPSCVACNRDCWCSSSSQALSLHRKTWQWNLFTPVTLMVGWRQDAFVNTYPTSVKK